MEVKNLNAYGRGRLHVITEMEKFFKDKLNKISDQPSIEHPMPREKQRGVIAVCNESLKALKAKKARLMSYVKSEKTKHK